jgi:hypothetical protein
MPQSFTSVVSSKPLRILITGVLDTWDPVERELRIGHDHFWMAPGVSVTGLRAGAIVTALGYQEDLTARRIVTALTLDTPRARKALDAIL